MAIIPPTVPLVPPKYLEKFTNLEESDEYVFPQTEYEFRLTQRLRTSDAQVIGASYRTRLTGTGPAPKDNARAQVRFTLLGADVDAQRATMEDKLYSFGLGLLHYSDGSKAPASIVDMPEIEVTTSGRVLLPVVIVFDIWDDFEAGS